MVANNRKNTKSTGPGRSSRSQAGTRMYNQNKQVGQGPAPKSESSAGTSKEAKILGSGLYFTQRALLVLVLVAILVVMYAGSLRVYFNQKEELAEAREKLAQKTEHIGKLTNEIERWKDPSYIRAQARTRLGWLVQGETGYRVLGADGKPVADGAEIKSEGDEKPGQIWWQKVWSSIEKADNKEKPNANNQTPPAVPLPTKR